MRVHLTDGGRAAAGFRGIARDCVVRSVAIATGNPYRQVYDDLFKLLGETPRNGVFTNNKAFRSYMEGLGFEWVATMRIGQGCKVHLRADELPAGTLVVKCSRHFTAVVDGVVHDNHDPSRDGKRCVYGYWRRVRSG